MSKTIDLTDLGIASDTKTSFAKKLERIGLRFLPKNAVRRA